MWGRCKSTVPTPGALPALYSAYDLALLIVRIEFGWLYKYLHNIRVRFDTRLYVSQEMKLWLAGGVG
jgi:hypothetical protein